MGSRGEGRGRLYRLRRHPTSLFPRFTRVVYIAADGAVRGRGDREAPIEAPGPSKPVENGPVDLAKRLEDVHYIAQLGGGVRRWVV